jgi:site-specific recombinase XerD
MIEHYLTYREVSQGRSKQTSVKYRLYLTRLIKFCEQTGLDLYQVNHDHLEAFTGVYVYKEMNMGPMARRAVVASVRGFYKWLLLKEVIQANPSLKLEYPKAPQKLPHAMPIDAAERLMWAPDLSTFTGIRDAAMLGLLIGCGIRVTGLVRLNTNNFEWSQQNGNEQLSIRVHEKGDKDRVVPVPDQARLLIRAYLGHSYLKSVNRFIDTNNQVMFISTSNRMHPVSEQYGENLRLGTNSVRLMIVKYGEKTGIPRDYCHPHTLRHLFGKELTEDDVDVLDRMGLMGHVDVKSAEIYSHIAQRKFRRIIDKSSPLSKMHTPVSDLSKILQ